MRIAKQIAEEHYPGESPIMARGMLENIIAAKMLPIRAALHMMWDNPESMTPSDMLVQYAEACEMLDDGCDHEWVDATNKVVSSGEVCLKCHAIRAAPEDAS